MFPDKLRVSSFPDRFSQYAWTAAWSAHSDFFGSRVRACFGVACHLHFWQNDRGLLHATVVTRGGGGGVDRTLNKSQHTKLALEKKILPPLLPGFELATFRSRVRRSNQQAIPVIFVPLPDVTCVSMCVSVCVRARVSLDLSLYMCVCVLGGGGGVGLNIDYADCLTVSIKYVRSDSFATVYI